MVLTSAGERLEPLARDLVKRARRATEVMDAVASEQQSFTVACPETTGNYFVAPFVAAGGRVSDIQPAVPAEVYGRLRRGADLAVNTSPPARGLRGLRLVTLAIRCMVRPEHPFAGRTSVELEELASAPFLMPGAGSAVERAVTQAGELSGFPLELATLTSNGILAQAHAAAGLGPALVVEQAFFDLEVVPMLHRGEPLLVTFFAGWERSHYAHDELAHLAMELADFMQECIESLGLSTLD
jgi:DNA-binding transcriptional LysR family regulator